jgi:hypothetical protein
MGKRKKVLRELGIFGFTCNVAKKTIKTPINKFYDSVTKINNSVKKTF